MTETNPLSSDFEPARTGFSRGSRELRRRFTGRIPQPVIVWLIALVALPLSRLFSPSFPSWALLNSTIILALFLTVIAWGQGLVVLTGGIDLSVATSVSVGAFFTGYLATRGLPTVLAVVLGVGIASVVGLVNGIIVSGFDFPPFIVTLAVGGIGSSLLLGISGGTPGVSSPQALVEIFANPLSVMGIRVVPIVLFGVVIALGYWVQSRTLFGRKTYAIGNSVQAAKVSGLKIKLHIVLVYWFAAIAYGLAGVLLLGYGSGSNLTVGTAWLFPSVAAVVVGGSSMSGGSGNYLGTVAAAILITDIGIDISAVGFSAGVQQIVYGGIIFVAIVLVKGVRRRR
jgi:ribose transport system permease protein